MLGSSEESIKKEYKEILNQLSDPELISDWEKFEELSKRKSFLEKILGKEKEIEELKNKIEENKLIISAKEDKELISLADSEIIQLQEKEKVLKKELNDFIYSEKKGAPQPLLIEIRAGAGGEEAALFVVVLFRMYSRYAQKRGWKQKTLHSHPTQMGGFKEIIFELNNGDVFSEMKYEGGVHRVQRIPTTEKAGRIHTSTASVAVLPKPKGTEIKIDPKDLKLDFYKASGAGGQYVNKRMTAVRITHLPTGMVATSQSERNLAQNRENAVSILEARLLEKKEREEMEKIGEKRKSQIGWAKRAEKIRTYNFPQDRITDHRIKKSWHDIEGIMDGKLDLITAALQKAGV
jgi:peptide chain release factor 1